MVHVLITVAVAWLLLCFGIGALREISDTGHSLGYSDLHQNTGQSPSLIDRNEFNQWRTDYWKQRAKDFE